MTKLAEKMKSIAATGKNIDRSMVAHKNRIDALVEKSSKLTNKLYKDGIWKDGEGLHDLTKRLPEHPAVKKYINHQAKVDAERNAYHSKYGMRY